MFRRHFIFLAPACAALAACEQSPDAADDTRDQLVGTWLREIEEGGVKARRVLVLQTNGKFTETTRITAADGAEKLVTGEGDWLFDGRNFKRRYARVDGGRIQFATFEVKFPSRTEFIGVDNVRKVQVTYRRVVDGTGA
ncbi:MAG: hypothetical protein H7332_11965 [Bdellovibrionales bacterium]|nr:hypothetical protein [Ramlibacter sp.]